MPHNPPPGPGDIKTTPPLSDPAPSRSVGGAISDVGESFSRWSVAAALGWQDAVAPYRRAVFGPAWIAVLPSFWALVIVIVFYEPLGKGQPGYIPYVFAGVVGFQYIQSLLIAGTDAFTRSSHLIRNIPSPLFLHLLRAFAKHFFTVLLQLPLVAGALIYAQVPLSLMVFWCVPGIIAITFAIMGGALALACMATIIRDLVHAVVAVMRIAFFVTPVFWYAESVGGARRVLADYNPLAHMLSLVRDPLLGTAPSLASWGIVTGLGLLGWCIGLLAFARYRMRIVAYL